jgi:Cys-tRNA(Pro) deacylase
MHPSAQKVADAARQLGLDIQIIEFEQTTRTAQEAADAIGQHPSGIGCQVAQIVKSLLFVVDGQPVVALVSGANQLDERKLAALRGVSRKRVQRADAETAKAATGFSIGGVPPFGHLSALPVYVDQDLTRFEVVWAAAGTPFAVFAITPQELVRASGGTVVDLAADR